MDKKSKEKPSLSSLLDIDGDEVFVGSTDFHLQCNPSSTSRSQLRVLRHSDSGGGGGNVTSISRSPTTELSPQRNSETKAPQEKGSSVIDNALQTEKDFMEYVMSLPSRASPLGKLDDSSASSTPIRKTSSRSCTLKTGNKVGLDHLDNLCKLMEQLSDLKEANSRLQKRVQYLEDVKSLHDMYEETKLDEDEPEIRPRRTVQLIEVKQDRNEASKTSPGRSQDRRFHSAIHKSKTQPNMTQKRSRERSKSVGHENVSDDNKSKKRFPKWSKVKEALGLERPTQYETRTAGNTRQEERKRSASKHNVPETSKSNVEGSRRVLTEDQVSALGIPVYSVDMDRYYDVSPCDSFASDIIGEGAYLAKKESLDDLNLIKKPAPKRQPGTGSRRSLVASSEDYIRRRKSSPSPTSSIAKQTLPDEIPGAQDLRIRSHTLEIGVDPHQTFEKLSKEDSKKANKGPWGRVKTIIQTRRDSLKRKQRKGDGKGEPGQSDVMTVDYMTHDLDLDDDYQDLETLSQLSGRRSVDALYEPEESRNASRKSSTREPPKPIPKVSRCEGEPQKEPHTARPKGKKPKPLDLRDESALYCETDLLEDDLLASPSSPTSQRRSRWTRMRKVFGKRDDQGRHLSRSAPSSPTQSMQGRTAFDFETFHNTEDDALDGDHSIVICGRHASTEGGEYHPLTSCASSPVANLFHELQNNLSEDFSKKIMEWERIRSTGGKCSVTISPVSSSTSKADSSTGLSRASKNKSERRSQEKLSKQRLKDLSWLEKELQKVEREKQRLAKEKQKYEEKAARLQKLKETVISAKTTNRNEVLIRTSAGEFRFEGISDDFTKKLYEWETKRGVGPDMSTIALLDSSLAGETSQKAKLETGAIPLQRGMSKSETSVIDTGQPSQTSSNSLPSLKQDNLTLDRLQPSRANSEPDLAAYSKEIRAHTPRIDIAGSSSNLIGSYTSEQATPITEEAELVGGSQGDLIEEFNISQAAEDSYYSLLEENMFLLEQLKSKEDICRKLEREIQYLDNKMVEMNRLHHEEMEKYRDKLWEVHKPGSKPVDLESSLKLISELKCTIEDLEKNSDRIKSDRQTLEDSFRYHSEQQAQLVIDLSQKMKELQNSRISLTSCMETSEELKSSNENWCKRRFRKLHELSTLLLNQGRELEQALAERTRQVCHLRWELLNRDVSSMRLQTELQASRWKSSGAILAPLQRSSRMTKAKRCWSSSDGIALIVAPNCASSDYSSEHGLVQNSVELFKDWPKTECQPSELSPIIHALKMELLKLTSKEDVSEDEPERSVSRAYSELSERNYERPYTSGTCHSSPPEAGVFESVCSSPSSSYPAVAPQIKVRRNSADNFSSVSGPECSESSSINENISFVLRLPTRRWAADNMSTSSESSYIEHFDARSSWSNSRSKLKVPAEFSSEGEDNVLPQDLSTEEVTIRYPLNLKRSRLRREFSRGSAYRDREADVASEFSSEDQAHSDGYRSVSCPDSPANSKIFFSQTISLPSRSVSEYTCARVEKEDVSNVADPESPKETPTFTVVLPRRFSGNKTEVEDSCVLVNPYAVEPQEEPTRTPTPKSTVNSREDLDTDTETKWKQDFPNLNVHRESPVIKSRSHRKLKSESSREKSDNEPIYDICKPKPEVKTDTAIAFATVEREHQQTSQPIPISNVRAIAVHKAKEEFIRDTTVFRLPAALCSTPQVPPQTVAEKTTISATKLREDDSKSEDSAKLVMCRSAESCQESRLARKTTETVEQDPISKPKGFLGLKLTSKRTQKKSEPSTVGALCRQSLFVNLDSAEGAASKKEISVSAKSCPSSPESKQKSKGGWFSKGIFKR